MALDITEFINIISDSTYNKICDFIINIKSPLITILFLYFFNYICIFKKGKILKTLKLSASFILLILIDIMIVVFNEYNKKIEFASKLHIIYFILVILSHAFDEEVIFRGIIGNILINRYNSRKFHIYSCVILNGVFFSMVHIPNFFNGYTIFALFQQIFVTFAVGVLFTSIYYRSGNIWILIFMHSMNNIMFGYEYIFFTRQIRSAEIANRNANWLHFIAPLVFLAYSAYILRPSKKNEILESFKKNNKK